MQGFITEKDIGRVMSVLGEDMSERELTEMLKAGDGDPHTKVQFITPQQLIKLLPPLCPSKVRALAVPSGNGYTTSLHPHRLSPSPMVAQIVRLGVAGVVFWVGTDFNLEMPFAVHCCAGVCVTDWA
jgi:hypothetical protein